MPFKPGESGNPTGRKKGVPNKATLARQAKIAASGLTPLDYLMGRVCDKDEDQDVRIDCAKAAAPYVHPRLQALQHTGEGGGPIKVTLEMKFGGSGS